MKKLKFLLKATVLSGIIIILGTAGASDLGRIDLEECFSRILLGLALICIGKAGLNMAKLTSLQRKRPKNFQKQKSLTERTANAA